MPSATATPVARRRAGPARRKGRGPRRAVRAVLGIVGLVVGYYLVTLAQVWLTSREDAPVRAQAIVVMGAAQYDGVPSPDLRARLDEALALYDRGEARLIVTSGWKEPGDAYTEAQAGKAYLEKRGVPASAILEAGGRSSWANLALAARPLLARGDSEVLVVTDPFHEDRSMAIATDVGLEPHPTPTRTSPIRGASVVPYFLETVAGVALGRIVGYERLHSIVP